MEESVALDTSKQKQFVKSVKGIKKLIKKKDKNDTAKTKDGIKEGKIFKKKKAKRGLVYLSHIPHGFYEHQMTEYFKQFGIVTNVRVIRSKRTGNSKGFAFVEFKEPAVAEIVAETMNNYLMGKRLLKAQCVPFGKQRRFALRKHWNNQKNPGSDARLKMKNVQNAVKTEDETLKMAKKLLSNISKTKKRLGELGIDYDFFTPVDIPEALQDKKETIEEKVTPNGQTQKKNKKSEPQQTKKEVNLDATKKDKNKKKVNPGQLEVKKDNTTKKENNKKNVNLNQLEVERENTTKKEINKKKVKPDRLEVKKENITKMEKNNKKINPEQLKVKKANIKKTIQNEEIKLIKAKPNKNKTILKTTNLKKEGNVGSSIYKTKKSKSLIIKRKNK